MVVDISKINLENLYIYQSNYRKKRERRIVPREPKEKAKYYKEYQHEYYMRVTKPKRLEKRGILSERKY